MNQRGGYGPKIRTINPIKPGTAKIPNSIK